MQGRQVGRAQRAHDVEGPIGHLPKDLGAGVLARGDLRTGRLGARVVDGPRRPEHHEAQHVDLGVGIGDGLLHHLVVGDDLAM